MCLKLIGMHAHKRDRCTKLRIQN